jgi:AcrR family transcriptional regulator
VAATTALHVEVGPARTTIAEIARRAGVQRLTVYNSFPVEQELFAACRSHYFAQHPLPDLTRALEIDTVRERLLVVLRDLYAWYRANERIMINIERDRASLNLSTRCSDRRTTRVSPSSPMRSRRAGLVRSSAGRMYARRSRSASISPLGVG